MKKLFQGIIALILMFTILLNNSIMVQASCPITSSTSTSASIEAEKYYNMLPSALRSKFESQGWEIMISDVTSVNMMSAMYGGFSLGGYVAGFTESYSKIIMLADSDAGSAMNHEMGHYFDYLQGRTSDSKQFSDIYKAESTLLDGGSNEYAKSETSEYFAEAFREYIECAGYLKNTCSRTYSYIDGLMAAYGGTSTNGIVEYTRCESHIVDQIAKAAADAAAKAARKAAQGALDAGANVLGKNAPKLDSWLADSQDIIDAINEDSEGYAKKKTTEWKEYLEGIDWDKKHEEAGEMGRKAAEDLNKKIEETDWEQKGKDVADKINKLFGGKQ